MNDLKSLPQMFLQTLTIAVSATLAVVLITRYVAPIPLNVSQTTTQKNGAFSASGQSVVPTVPDKVEVILGISRKETDIKKAQTNANQIINNISTKLGEMGVAKDDVKTQNYSISPTYDYQKATQDIVGYSVDITLNVSLTDFEKLNQVIDTATALGANQIGGIQFTLSEAKEKEVRAQAREQAIQDAKANATELARLSGVKLGKVVNVIEDTGATPQPLMYAKAADAVGGMGGAPTNVQPGTTQYNYSVTLEYETL